MRSVGNVSLAIGLVNCPVQMMPLTDNHDRRASMYHYHESDGSYAKVKMPKSCEGCGAVVSQGDTVKGFEEDGEVVMLSADELETIESNSGKEFTVERFVPAGQIDPLLHTGENAYRLVPDTNPKRGGKQALTTYLTVRQVLVEDGLVGIVQYSRWGRNRLGALVVEPTEYGGVLVVRNMIWADEFRAPEFSVLSDAVDTALDSRLLPVARTLIGAMVGDFQPQDFRDTYMEALSAAITAKAGGGVVTAIGGDDVTDAPDDVSDLLAKLEASIAAKGAAKGVAMQQKAAA